MEELTKKNFKEQLKNPLVIVDVWASWCGPCRALAPIFESVSERFAGQAKFLKCNVDQNQELAIKQGVMSIPCVIVFKNGEAVDRQIGLVSEAELKCFVERQL